MQIAVKVLLLSDESKMIICIRDLLLSKLRKVRTSIPRTINENFSHLISMGYQ